MKKILLLLATAFLIPLPVFAKADVYLSVPFTSEIPNGAWVGPWKNGCEEASIVMVEKYYLGQKKLTKTEAKNTMQKLFNWEDKNYGFNADTDAEQTAGIINDYSSFEASIKRNPTLDDIKKELDEGRPVITFHYGFGLNNPLIPFLRSGSSYHVMVVVGYDDSAQEFIMNDVGNHKSGLDYRYKYATILNTLHDFNYTDKKADGTPTALFTAPKNIVKVAGGARIYLVRDGKKYYIANPKVFKNHRWSWNVVKPISKEELDKLPNNLTISK